MSPQSTVIKFDTIRSISSTNVSASYAIVGSSLTYGARILKIINNSSQDVTVSFDGINDHDYVITKTVAQYDFGTNRGNSSPSFELAANSAVYVKGTAGTGNIYLVYAYGYDATKTLPGI